MSKMTGKKAGTKAGTKAGPIEQIEGHGGQLALAALRAFGVTRDVHALRRATSSRSTTPPTRASAGGSPRIVDVRHEQSAVFAAEAVAKLQRRPGLAVLTAGPGVTNGISGLTSAYFNGAPVIVVGGRAPQFRWGAGSLQEIDHLPLVAAVTKNAATVDRHRRRGRGAARRRRSTALTPHRGPVFLDLPLDVVFSFGAASAAGDTRRSESIEPDPDEVAKAAALLARRAAPGDHRGLRRVRRRRRRGAARGRRGAADAGLHQRHGPGQPAARAPARVRQGPPGRAAGRRRDRRRSARRWTSG